LAFSISQTAAPIINISKAASAATDFFAVIDAPKPSVTGLKDPDVSPLDDIVLDSVTFAYPSRPHVMVLDDLSMRFEFGKITAIVGASGSGKSTIVGLLERWYNLDQQSQYKLPESAIKNKKADKEKSAEPVEESNLPISLSGSILVGTHNLDSVDLKWWRSQIGLVQQEPFIFNDTIYKNVENGLIGSKWEDEDAATKKSLVEEACKEAFADEYINRLPQVRSYGQSARDSDIDRDMTRKLVMPVLNFLVARDRGLLLLAALSNDPKSLSWMRRQVQSMFVGSVSSRQL
jgi:ATP-binding cassette subfamily B (MDR/TAP) protein 1